MTQALALAIPVQKKAKPVESKSEASDAETSKKRKHEDDEFQKCLDELDVSDAEEEGEEEPEEETGQGAERFPMVRLPWNCLGLAVKEKICPVILLRAMMMMEMKSKMTKKMKMKRMVRKQSRRMQGRRMQEEHTARRWWQ